MTINLDKHHNKSEEGLLNYLSSLRKKYQQRIVSIYLVSVLLSLTTLLLQFYLSPILGKEIFFLLALTPIIIACFIGGLAGGLLTTTLSAIGFIYYHFAEIIPYSENHFIEIIQLAIYITEGILISIVVEKNQKNKQFDQYLKREKEFAKLIITEHEAVEQANQEIKARDEFLSIASHELKNPLTTMLLQIQSTLHNIKNTSLANFSVQNLLIMLEGIEQQTQRLSKMINDLLNVSLITTGRIDLETQKLDLAQTTKNVVSNYSTKLARDGRTVKLETDNEIIGNWDKVRIEQVITNLIDNAIKYGDGKPIEVKVTKNGSSASLAVKDQGIGIPEEKQKAIFDRFKRGVSAKEFEGLGVGLYITKQIIIAHKGKIDIISKPGLGTTFIVELPVNS